VEESNAIVHAEFGPQSAFLDARHVARDGLIFLYPLSGVDTVVLNIGVAGVWTLSAIQPVDGSRK